jgi:hypothetical protein
MSWFKKENTIEFFSLIPEVAELAPMQNARNFRPELLVNSTKAYADEKVKDGYGMTSLITTAKCPGVYNYARHGWVLTTWQDITIETNGDGSSFLWTSPIDQSKCTNGNMVGEAIGSHSRAQYADFIGGSIPMSLDTIIKVNTPWRCNVPNGYYLQESALPYSSEKRFTTMTGFFSMEHGLAQLNVQLLWHVMKGKTLIKAGTPIAHYMLIPKDQPKMKSMAATPEQIKLEETNNIELKRRFVADVKEHKCVFAKLFNNK